MNTIRINALTGCLGHHRVGCFDPELRFRRLSNETRADVDLRAGRFFPECRASGIDPLSVVRPSRRQCSAPGSG